MSKSSRRSSAAASASSLAETLPQVWQDLFTATRVAQSTGHLQRMACQPAVGALHMHACSRAAFDDPLLGINQVAVFTQFLCPEALVRQHWLGVP